MTLKSGDILGGRYRIAKLVGQGGFGAVYRAWDTSLGVPVALKENLDTSQEGQRQFEQEAKLLAPLRHNNLPRVSDHFFVPGQGQYLVMDFVEGRSLADLLRERGGPLHEAEALGWIGQVCDALAYLHTRTPPIIHRDIKPENIILTAGGRAMLVDFGISKAYDPGRTTTRGARAVTPGFSPPEQYGMGKTDARSDVYALGATLFTLLTGQPPPESVALIAGNEMLPSVRLANPGVSATTEAAVLGAMALSVSQRLPDAAAFKGALAGKGVAPLTSVGKTVVVSPVAAPRRGVPVWLAALLSLAAMVVVAVGVYLWLNGGGSAQGGEPTGEVVELATDDAPAATEERATEPVATVEPTASRAEPTPAPTHTPRVTAVPASRRVIAPVVGMEIEQVLVPAGAFMMGADDEDSDVDEDPIHEVRLDAFWMDRTEVTNAQYAAFAADTGYVTADERDGEGYTVLTGQFESVSGANWRHPQGPGSDISGLDDHPVVLVSWEDARAYCEWAGGRLPTEAEWEYAARGPDATTYPWGDAFSPQRVNFCGRDCPMSWADDAMDDGYRLAAAVGTFSGGESWAGAEDMAGNVWEWTADWYDPDYYARSPVNNPTGPEGSVDEDGKSVRGGAWSSTVQGVRSAVRVSVGAWRGHFDVGIRCVHQPTSPVAAEPAENVASSPTVQSVALSLVEVPAGVFLLGSVDSDPDADDDESPQRAIYLDGFSIARTETTNGQYASCVGDGACQPPRETSSFTRAQYYGEEAYADYPVVNVGWNDAMSYCEWAGGRLPTEAEWEKAARSTQGAAYPWGNAEPTCALANYNNCIGDTTEVGSYPAGASPFGVLDMAGNVWEWVADWYDSGYYAVAPESNPTGPTTGEVRGFRGGAWDDSAHLMRAAYRDAYIDRTFNLAYVGFRCAWD